MAGCVVFVTLTGGREAEQWWHMQWAAQARDGGAGQKRRSQEEALDFGAA